MKCSRSDARINKTTGLIKVLRIVSFLRKCTDADKNTFLIDFQIRNAICNLNYFSQLKICCRFGNCINKKGQYIT